MLYILLEQASIKPGSHCDTGAYVVSVVSSLVHSSHCDTGAYVEHKHRCFCEHRLIFRSNSFDTNGTCINIDAFVNIDCFLEALK